MKMYHVLLASLLLAITFCTLQAQIPRTLSYQGVLTDSVGNAKPDGQYILTFRLYASQFGGSPLWTELKSVQVKRGFFYNTLGEFVPIPDSVKFDRQYWLGIQPSTGTELVPRVPLTSVGYSLTASKVTRPISPPLVNNEIADSSLTGAKIANGQVVRSLNGLKDSVTLVAGANVVIAPIGNRITVSATSSGGGGVFTLPYAGAVTADPTGFLVTNNGNGGAGWFEMTSPASINPALFARSAGPGSAIEGVALGNAYAVSGHSASNNAWAGYFTLSNPANNNSALFSNTNGGGEAVFGYSLGTGKAGRFEINNPASASDALTATTNGMGNASSFTINNIGNPNVALNVATNGLGHASSFTISNANSFHFAVNAVTNGTSSAGNFVNTNAAHAAVDPTLYSESNSNSPAVYGINKWQGPAGKFENYATSIGPTLWVISNGEPGHGIFSQKTGDNGSAGYFWNSKASNIAPAVFALSSGFGPAVQGNGGPHGRAGWFLIDTSSNGSTALEASTVGLGPAARFTINNASNIQPALTAETNGTGQAAFFRSANATSANPALYVSSTGTTNTAEFTQASSSSSGNAIYAQASGKGAAVFARGFDSPGLGLLAANGSTGNAADILQTGPTGNAMLAAVNTGAGDAIQAYTGGTGYAVHALAQGTNKQVAWLEGDVNISGRLTKTTGSFKIDHPLDPANKYLSHSFVESPDMMNVYNGNVTLDGNGEAWVQLPDWFEALNRDYRYQLTCIGGYAPIYVAQELKSNRFKISGGKGGLKVSWQVTGIRQDPYANAHRIQVEEDKVAGERGRYRHPEVYGQPAELGVDWESQSKVVQQLKIHEEQMLKQVK